jgi:predicted ATPase
MRAQVRREGFTRVTFRCSPYHTNSALYPVIEHVQRVFQLQRDDPPAAKLDKLERTLRTYRLPLEDVVPLFAALLSVPLPEERYTALRLTPQQQKQQTHDALVAWMLEEAERQPVLVVWEDLHWADPSTLENLGLLLDQSRTSAILNLLTFRPEFVPPWPSRSHMTPLTLNRLERPQVEALITTQRDTPERVRSALTLQTTLGPALMATRGYAAPEVAATYHRARELCQQAGDTADLFPVL